MTHIAIVEDQEEIREGLAEMLAESGQYACVGTYASGEELLSAVGAVLPDLLILDLGLPGMSGAEALVRLKALAPQMKVLVSTVFDNDDKVFEALKAGADGYLLKKESHDALLEAIADLMQGGAPMSREIARRVLSSFQEKPAVHLNEVLNPKEIVILEQLSKGYLYKEIAAQMDTSLGMVKQYLHRIYEKLHVQNKTEAINKYLGRTH
jgi:DNA-binding NarL/FixJ family response regulator